MPAEKIDARALALEADKLAQQDVYKGIPGGMWFLRRDEHFARLVMEECEKVCESEDPYYGKLFAAAIREVQP